jgi:glyoxylase-like metal-dependent hydrolase (beta-lactamase superfamily II)
MTRALALGLLLAGGGLTIGVTAWQGGGQQQRSVTVDQVKDNLYVLRNGGGNTAVFVRSDGVVVVDAKNPGWGQTILDQIRQLTPKPVTLLINTHTHGDHVGGNPQFAESVEIVVHENTRTNMAKMEAFAQGGPGAADRTFTDRLTLGSGADAVELRYFGPGHTNGDAWVIFPALRTVHAGDIFAGKSMPLVDANNGGSVLRYPETLTKAHAGITGVDTIINGHSATTTTWADLAEFAEFNQDFVAWAQAQIQAGKSPEEAAAEWQVPAKYEGYSSSVSNLFGGLPGRIQVLANEMRGGGHPGPRR